MTPEGYLKKEIKAYLNSRGIYWAIVPEGTYGKSGDPDLIACYNGMFVGLEAKTYEGRQSGIQAVRQKEIEASGGVYAIVRNLHEVEAALKEADERMKTRRRRKDVSERPAEDPVLEDTDNRSCRDGGGGPHGRRR